jgi:hypothetical protein
MSPCRACGKDISQEASTCPLCGCKRPTYQSWLAHRQKRIGAAIASFLLGCFVSYVGVTSGPDWVMALGAILFVGGLGIGVSDLVGLIWTIGSGKWQLSASRK